jgi:hypothetical protein
MNIKHSINFAILTKFNKIKPSRDFINHWIHTSKLHNAYLMHQTWKFNKLRENSKIELQF